MSARVIDGKAVALEVRRRVAVEVEQLASEHGITPGLATVLVGDDPASALYVRRKREACAEVGIESFHNEPGGDVTAEALREIVAGLNEEPRVHGILVQLPLPPHLDAGEITALIDPLKDVDGLTPVNAGLLARGAEGMVPCTPAGVMELLKSAGVELEGARAVVVGRSALVGRPLASLLLQANATVTQCHSRTRDLAAVCREADVLRESIDAGAPRPVTPAYSDISLAIQRTYHPEAKIEVNDLEAKLKERLEKAAEGKIF